MAIPARWRRAPGLLKRRGSGILAGILEFAPNKAAFSGSDETGVAAATIVPPRIAYLLLFSLAYLAGAVLGYWLMCVPEKGIALWPPCGFYLAALVCTPRQQWPWFMLAALPAEVAASMFWFHFSLPASLAVYLGNTSVALV